MSSSSLQAIETHYKGYRFRSRLEARWAVFLTVVGVIWEYEKEGYDLGGAGNYLPDFWIPAPWMTQHPNAGCFLEIKGQEPTTTETWKASALAIASHRPVKMVIGAPGTCSILTWLEKDFVSNRIEMVKCPGVLITRQLVSQFHGNCNKCGDAIAASRAARFEHNERLD